jgi:aspartate carbamoyltransferase catalytic subunit
LNGIFEVAQEMEAIERDVTSPGSNMLKGYLMATLFYEPSTRTRLSFESSMKRLGGVVLTTENAREFSSAAKGETLEGRSTLSFFFFDKSGDTPPSKIKYKPRT